MSIAMSMIIACNSTMDLVNDKFDESLEMESLSKAKAELQSLLDDMNQSLSTKSEEERVISDWFTVYATTNDSTRAEDVEKAVLHVFNFAEDKGFAILSADENSPTLYACTLNGRLDKGDIIENPGFSVFLYYLDLLIDGVEPLVPVEPFGPFFGNHTDYGDWENVFYNKEGYCNVKWSQDDPYNSLCKEIDGKHCVTGCAATAMSQYMSIHKYPESYNGYFFDWDKMTVYPWANFCSEEGKSDIANLMKQLGTNKNLDVRYGLDNSFADIKNIPRTFRNFGYSQGGEIVDYKTNEIVQELRNGNCVLVSGYKTKKDFNIGDWTLWSSYEGGHVWLAHGLLERTRKVYTYVDGKCVKTDTESQWYPLYNWGKDGICDGFFLSGVFDKNNEYVPTDENENQTRGNKSDYQYNVKLIKNIRK